MSPASAATRVVADTSREIAVAAAKRLKELRLKAGFSTANEAADAMGCNRNTYHQHESGLRPITRKAAVFYALHYKVTVQEIMVGTRLQLAPRVLIVGVVGSDGWAKPSVAGRVEGAGESAHAPSL